MPEQTVVRSGASKATGRSWGAMFFAFFGGCWLLLSTYEFGRLAPVPLTAICVATFVFTGIAFSIQQSAKKIEPNPVPTEQERHDSRTFGIVNAVEGIFIFLIFALFPRLKLNDFTFPAVLLVVAGHFFFIPRSYRHSATIAIGAALAIWAILCLLLLRGDPMVGYLGLGAGIILWIGAGVWIAAARRHLEDYRG